MLGLCGAVLLATSAPGQQTPPAPAETPLRPPRLLPPVDQTSRIEVDSELRALAGALADPSYDRREAAMRALSRGTWEIPELCSLLSEPLAPEQRYRLLSILRQRIDSPRGAVGISMQWQQPHDGEPGAVEITDLVPGLPAEEVLLIGDHVTHVDGRPLNFMADLRVLVQSRKPGEKVTLRVLRAQHDENGDLVVNDEGRVVRKPLTLALRLGSAHMLLDPRTGLPTPGGSVEDSRARESRRAVARYAPRPVVVEIRGGEERGLVLARTHLPISDEDVEADPNIQTLKRRQHLIATGQIALTQTQLATWQRLLDRLHEMVERPGLSDREVELRQRVAERFAELLDG